MTEILCWLVGLVIGGNRRVAQLRDGSWPNE